MHICNSKLKDAHLQLTPIVHSVDNITYICGIGGRRGDKHLCRQARIHPQTQIPLRENARNKLKSFHALLASTADSRSHPTLLMVGEMPNCHLHTGCWHDLHKELDRAQNRANKLTTASPRGPHASANDWEAMTSSWCAWCKACMH